MQQERRVEQLIGNSKESGHACILGKWDRLPQFYCSAAASAPRCPARRLARGSASYRRGADSERSAGNELCPSATHGNAAASHFPCLSAFGSDSPDTLEHAVHITRLLCACRSSSLLRGTLSNSRGWPRTECQHVLAWRA